LRFIILLIYHGTDHYIFCIFAEMIKIKLVITCFLQYAVMGAYSTSLGRYLVNIGMGDRIGYFYAMMGVVSIVMPAIIGAIGDKWIQAQRLLGICHLSAAVMMLSAAYYGYLYEADSQFVFLFGLYSLSIAFYMPTISLSNSVILDILSDSDVDIVKNYSIIRMFGTIGFISAMLMVDILGMQTNYMQLVASGIIGILLSLFTIVLPHCRSKKNQNDKQGLFQFLGLSAFKLFRYRQFAIFLIFSMLLNICLQTTNSFANTFFNSFAVVHQYAHTFGVNHSNILMSFGQMSETVFMFLLPFIMRRLNIKTVMTVSMLAWVIHFSLLACGNPGDRMWMFVVAMILYGMAFDFYSIAGTLFVDEVAGGGMRATGQGLYMIMTGGFGTMIGTIWAQMTVSSQTIPMKIAENSYTIGHWSTVWMVFALFAFLICAVFVLIFKPKKVIL